MTETIVERYLELGLRLGRHVDGIVDSYAGPPEIAAAVEAEPLREPGDARGRRRDAAGRGRRRLAARSGARPPHQRLVHGRRARLVRRRGRGLLRRPAGAHGRVGVRGGARGARPAAAGRWPAGGALRDAGATPSRSPRTGSRPRWRPSSTRRAHGRAGSWSCPTARAWTSRSCATSRGWRSVSTGAGCAARSRSTPTCRSRPSSCSTSAATRPTPAITPSGSARTHRLVRGEGRLEETLVLMPTPQSLVSEGIAELGSELLLSNEGGERLTARARASPASSSTSPTRSRSQRAREPLGWAEVNVSLMLHEDGASADEAQAYLARWGLMDAGLRRPRGPLHHRAELAHVHRHLLGRARAVPRRTWTATPPASAACSPSRSA